MEVRGIRSKVNRRRPETMSRTEKQEEELEVGDVQGLKQTGLEMNLLEGQLKVRKE